MGKLFGTDGIRGIYGKNLTNATAYLLGRTLTEAEPNRAPLIVTGRDTRPSGKSLEGSFCYGVTSAGGQVLNLGILPVNAVSYYTRSFGADYGVMFSASHNPPEYNGLKVFDAFGLKLCAEKEKALEMRMNRAEVSISEGFRCGNIPFENIAQNYAEILTADVCDLSELFIVADCAFGSAFSVAERAFSLKNARAICRNNENRGDRINRQCGATFPEFLKTQMPQGYDLGFAFDGDADRCVVLQGNRILDGNRLLYLIAKYLHETGRLHSQTVVGTVLTNGGVERALATQGLTLHRADVGDKNVFAALTSQKTTFGGEESGHYLFADRFSCSDGIYTALITAQIYKEKGDLFEYSKEFRPIPSVQKNLPMSPSVLEQWNREGFFPNLTEALLQRFPTTKILVRASGTEPQVRIFAESEDEAQNRYVTEYAEGLLLQNAAKNHGAR